MKAIQKMKLSKLLRLPSQDFTDESSPFHRYPRVIQVKEQRINHGSCVKWEKCLILAEVSKTIQC